jgi:hypothetical protein
MCRDSQPPKRHLTSSATRPKVRREMRLLMMFNADTIDGPSLLRKSGTGTERVYGADFAEIRTHVLVSIGAAMFTLTGAYGFADIVKGPNIDPARIAAQVASGIGFVGAGAILRDRGGVRGLTTAATVLADRRMRGGRRRRGISRSSHGHAIRRSRSRPHTVRPS